VLFHLCIYLVGIIIFCISLIVHKLKELNPISILIANRKRITSLRVWPLSGIRHLHTENPIDNLHDPLGVGLA